MENTGRPVRYVIFGFDRSARSAAIYNMEKEHGVVVLEDVNTLEDLAAAEESCAYAIATDSYNVAAAAMRKGAQVVRTEKREDFLDIPVYVNLADLASGDMETVRTAISSALYPVMQAIFEVGGEHRASLPIHGHHMAQKACENVADMWAEAAARARGIR